MKKPKVMKIKRFNKVRWVLCPYCKKEFGLGSVTVEIRPIRRGKK